METKIFKIAGGISPGDYRSTSLALECEDVQDGYNKVVSWSKKNFPDWNYIGVLTDGKPLLGLISVTLPTSVYSSGKFFSAKGLAACKP